MLLYVASGVIALSIFLLWQVLASYAKLRHIPGPPLYALTRFRLAYDAWNARSIHTIQALHQKYGPVVRVGPNQVSFNSLSALRTIYGAGSNFERTSFYKMFDAYGTPNLFTFASGVDHRNRKKLVSHMYSNQRLMEDDSVRMMRRKVRSFLDLLETEPETASEIFTSLHYFSFDAISEFVYGPKYGGTNCLGGNKHDRALIDDILNPARRRLAWFFIHFPVYTKFVISRTGLSAKLIEIAGLLPMPRPFTYTGIRAHALKAFYQFKTAIASGEATADGSNVMSRLFEVRAKHDLRDLDIASECADHLLAGIDTTADSLMFLIWAISLPGNQRYQKKLMEELGSLDYEANGWPDSKHLARLPWLNAILKESLRLYTPLPAFEPRQCPIDTTIDGHFIPTRTVVGMSPYCMHREEAIYPEARIFKPERWLDEGDALLPESVPANKWFWAFSSGARMCIGSNLANAEMLLLIAAVYRNYCTSVRFSDTSPAITSRYEIFADENMTKVAEHKCYIDFYKL